MKQKKVKGIWRGLTTIIASGLVLMLCGTSVAYGNSGAINRMLGTSNYRVVQNEEGQGGEGIYFESEFDTLGELQQAKQELAKELASEGTVLLKNENGSLPLNVQSEKVTVWGLNSNNPTYGGLIGSQISVNADAGQRLYGIVDSLTERGVTVNTTMSDFYASETCSEYYRAATFFGQKVPGHSLVPAFGPIYEESQTYVVGELPANIYTSDVLASAQDTTAIVFIARDSSEASDYSTQMQATNGDNFERPLALSKYEKDMIELAKQHSNGKVVVMLNSDMTLEIEELKQDPEISAIVWTGLPGAYGFLSVVDVLSGTVNPSGHLADTYAVNSVSAPAMHNFGINLYTNNSQTGDVAELNGGNKADWFVVEGEGIYIGYKYYETRYEDLILGRGNADSNAGSSTEGAWDYESEVSYPFGYGMSYTTFEQKLRSVEVDIGGKGKAVVEVKNTGNVAGKAVVQLYVQSPYTKGGLEKSAIQLLDFGKTDVLEPGASQELSIEFDPQYMASYDEDAVKANGTEGAWVLDEGDYYFSIGNGAHEALNNVLAAKTGNAVELTAITLDEKIDAENTVKVTLQKDIETYSKNVQNAFQDADINHLIEDTVEYTTRGDWTKGWTEVTDITPTKEMMKNLTNKVYELNENGNGVTWGGQSGFTLADMIDLDEEGNMQGVVPLDDFAWDQLVQQIPLEEALSFFENGSTDFGILESLGVTRVGLNDGPVGFVTDQIPSYYAQWDESNSGESTYLTEKDEYANWSMAVMPTEPVVASTFNKELIKREGEILGEDSLWANNSGIMAPGLNLHRATYCSRNHDYYSEDAMVTNLMGVAFCTGAEEKGMMAEPKHIAANHQEANRTGVSTFFTEQSMRENEMRGFQGALESNKAKGVMTAFNRVGTTFAGAHSGMLEQVVRNEWNFTGFIVSDAVNGADYMNWRDNIYNGGGAMLGTSDKYAAENIGSMLSAENIEKIEKDTEFQQKMQETLKYYLYTFAGNNVMNGITADTEFVYQFTWWQTALIVSDIVLAVLTLGFAIMYVRNIVAVRKNRKAGD